MLKDLLVSLVILAYAGGVAVWAWVFWVAWQFMRGRRSHEINYSPSADNPVGDYGGVPVPGAGKSLCSGQKDYQGNGNILSGG